MRNQIEIIKQQLDSLNYEVNNGGLNVPFKYYPVIDQAIKTMANALWHLMTLAEEAEKTKAKKRQKNRGR